MAEIWAAHGICSAIRPKLLTALGPYGFKGLQIEAWAQDEDGTHQRSDEDSLAPLHVARIAVSDQAAEWCEYLICRYAAAYPGSGMRLMSKPINPANQRWAAKWDSLPRAWRQKGCTSVPPAKPQGKRSTLRSNAPALLGVLRSLFAPAPAQRQPQQRRRTARARTRRR